MTIHRQMFDGKNGVDAEINAESVPAPPMNRIYVEFEGGYFVSLGVIDASFQQMIEEHGRPTKVEFRATDEGRYQDEDGEDLLAGRRDA